MARLKPLIETKRF